MEPSSVFRRTWTWADRLRISVGDGLAKPVSRIPGPRFAFVALEPQLQSHLDDARRSGAGDSAKTAGRDRRPGVIQIRVIQPVEEFRPVLQTPPFRNP